LTATVTFCTKFGSETAIVTTCNVISAKNATPASFLPLVTHVCQRRLANDGGADGSPQFDLIVKKLSQ
jgi:hypothetical protein